MAQKPSTPSGTRDFLPEVMMRRERIFQLIRATFQKYGFAPIETPAMESLAVLTGKYGEEGDRLIFKILNSGDFFSKRSKQIVFPEDVAKGEKHFSSLISEKALRYDLTVPFARFVVANQNELSFPFKRYQIQPVWRADRPQKGRYREFYQCDGDVVGSDSLILESEFIAIFDEVISALGISAFSIQVSNRKVLQGFAEYIGEIDKFQEMCVAIDKWDKIGEEGVNKELIGRGISEEKVVDLLSIVGFQGTNEEKLAFLKEKFTGLTEGMKGIAEMEEVLELHQSMPQFSAQVDFELTLARGLDYYTGTIFEVKPLTVSMGSIGSGGRYDDLTGLFGKPGLSGVGISFGADRIYDVMEKLSLFQDERDTYTQVLIIYFGKETLPAALRTLRDLRKIPIATEIYPDPVKLKKQFSYADKKGIPLALIIGEEEIEKGLYQLKNLRTGEQTSYAWKDLIAKILSI